MNYIHQIINSDKLVEIFDLPPFMKGKSVEVIILPLYNEINETMNVLKKNQHQKLPGNVRFRICLVNVA